MNARYQPTSNSFRALAAVVAVVTAAVLFDFVAALGDSGTVTAQARSEYPATQVAGTRASRLPG